MKWAIVTSAIAIMSVAAAVKWTENAPELAAQRCIAAADRIRQGVGLANDSLGRLERDIATIRSTQKQLEAYEQVLRLRWAAKVTRAEVKSP